MTPTLGSPAPASRTAYRPTRPTAPVQVPEACATQRLTITYLVSQYPLYSQTFVLREVRALRERGIDLRVVSVRSPDRAAERMTAAERAEVAATRYVIAGGVAGALRANLAALVRRPRAYLAGLRLALGLGRLDLRRTLRDLTYFVEAAVVGESMRQAGTTHLHAHFCSHVGYFVSRMFPVTYSATIHGPTELNDPTLTRLAERVRAASFVCTVSRYTRARLLLLVPPSEWEKIVPVPLGVDTARYRPAARPSVGEGTPGPEKQPVEILCVARLADQKGHHILLAAFEALCRGGRSVRLRLVGDGPLRAALEAEVAARGLRDRVVFHGVLNEDETLGHFASAAVFALASLAEGKPVSLMEAMASGVPCVATYVAGVPELIRDGVDGLLVPAADGAALAAALARLVDDPSLRRRLGDAGRRRVVERYDAEARADELAAVLRMRVPKAGAVPAGAA